MAKKIDRVASEAQEVLRAYSWPGNVRELANVLERAVILCDGGELNADQLGISFPMNGSQTVLKLQDFERTHIMQTLEKTSWVVGGPAGAAKLLGLNRTTLLAKMKKLGIERPV
jgi:formate hydrogenlyase transcriptional activator